MHVTRRPDLFPEPASFVPDVPYTLAQWQAIEEATGQRYEYHAGRLLSVEAMAGGSPRHALLIGNVAGVAYRELSAEAFQAQRCGSYSSDLRIAIQTEERYVYPDLAIVCGRPAYDAAVPSAIANPVAVFEVLSPSSRDYDAGPKFGYYRELASLRDYILVSQHERRVEVRSRAGEEAPWRISVYTEADEAFELAGLLGVSFGLADLYRLWEA